MAEDLTRILECPMCFELYDSTHRWPKLLPCQHTFCQPCLVLLDKNQQISCPQCRIDHNSPPGGAKQLQNNFTMLSLIDLHHKTAAPPMVTSSVDGDAIPDQNRINENVRNAVAGLAQKLQDKASELSKIDTKRKQIEEKFLGVKAKLDAAFDARAKELQTRRESLIKQLGSLRQEELNFLEGQKASATQYLQKFQQDFAGMRESLQTQQRLPNEAELTNLLTMCRGYMQQIDKYALNIDQKDRHITFVDPTKMQLTISVNGYGCINNAGNLSPAGGGDGVNSPSQQSNTPVNIPTATQQYPGISPLSSMRPNMSAPSMSSNRSPTSNNNTAGLNRSGPSFNNAAQSQSSSSSSQYMFPPTPRSVHLHIQGQRSPSDQMSPSSSTTPASSSASWMHPGRSQDSTARIGSPSATPPYAINRSASPNLSVSSMNSDNSSAERRRSLNPFLQDQSPPTSLSPPTQPMSSLSLSSPQSANNNSAGRMPQATRGHSPLPARQTSVSSIPTPTQSSSNPGLGRTRHASLDLTSHSQPMSNLQRMAAITEQTNRQRQLASGDASMSASRAPPTDIDYNTPPPLPPRKGASARKASAAAAAASSANSSKPWVKFDTLRRDTSPTKSQSVTVIGKSWFGDYFEKPVGAVSLSDGLMAVLDERNHNVLIVSSAGQHIRTLGTKGNAQGQFQFPRGICSNTAGHVVVSDWLNNRIQLWEPTGKFVRQFGIRGQGEANLNGPVGVVCDQQDNIYVCDYNNHCVKVFNAAGGFIRQIGKHGQGDGMFLSPSHIVISPGGELLITDAGKHCVQVFTKQGTFLYAVGQWGTGSGQLNCPTGITIDQNGYLYVANSGNHRIEVFNPSGSFSMSLGTQGKEEGQFDEPLGVATTDDGRLIVCDSGNKRLQILRP